MRAFFHQKSHRLFLLLFCAFFFMASGPVRAEDPKDDSLHRKTPSGPQYVSAPDAPVPPSFYRKEGWQGNKLPSRSYNELYAVCGDGVTHPGEDCDDGNRLSGDGCSDLCSLEDPVACGNLNTDPGETCDDGNLKGGDGCSATCQIEAVCGDGVVVANEQCDDGNESSGDGCSNKCLLERTGDIEKAAVEKETPEEVQEEAAVEEDPAKKEEAETLKELSKEPAPTLCGNGFLDPSEECDDGNVSNGDGCSSACRLEKTGEKNTQYLKHRAETSPAGCLAECTVAVEFVDGQEVKRYEVAGERKVTGGGTVYSNKCKQPVSCLTGLVIDSQEQYCTDQPVVVNCPLG